MMKEPAFEETGAWPIFFLLFNALTWFYITGIVVQGIIEHLDSTYLQNLVWASFYSIIVGSSIFGAIISDKLERFRLLRSWLILGIISPLLTAFSVVTDSIPIHALTISLFLGFSFGLGMPSCLSCFSEQTSIEHRGKLSGAIFVAANLCAPIFGVWFTQFGLLFSSIAASVWCMIGLFFLLLPKQTQRILAEAKTNAKSISFSSVLSDRSFLSYFVAWLMFCFVDRLVLPALGEHMKDFFFLAYGPIIGSISALIGGVLADRVGRKRVILYSFATLGIAYAVIGVAPETLFNFSWYLHLILGSVAAGMLWVIFILVLWGDLAKGKRAGKYYAIGAIPFFLSEPVLLVSYSYVSQIPVTSAFSFASFFIFLVVPLLLYAPETLPKKVIEKRRLQKYLDDVQRVKKEYERDSSD